MRLTAALLTLAGVALAAWLVHAFDADAVFAAVSAIGAGGFAAFCGFTVAILIVLGAAQWCVLPGVPAAALPGVVWARWVREGAGDVLPFTQLGGIVVGARVLGRLRLPAPRLYAAIMADQTAELAAQAVFTIGGVAGLAWLLLGDGRVPWGLVAAGMGASVAVMMAFVLAQGPMLSAAEGLARRLLPRAETNVVAMRGELRAIYARRGGLVACALLHLLGWTLSGLAAWLALRLMGVEIGIGPVLVIEALVFALRSAAFFVPGGLGVQEAAYALLGPLLGLDPETALALSLVKRSREFALGAPALVAWQLGEGRRWLARGQVQRA